MGLKNTAKKTARRIGNAFGLSALQDELLSLRGLVLAQDDHIQALSNRLNELEESIKHVNESIGSTRELVAANFDISMAPAAKGRIRWAQEANFKLLQLFKNICEENNLEFYLHFGSLLGAIRHGGYIPWDDDIDVMMIREDYNKLPGILERKFQGTDLFFVRSEITRIYYGATPIQIDIFPSDFYKRPIEDTADRIKTGKRLKQIHDKYIVFDWEKLKTQERSIVNLSYEEIEDLRRRLVGPDVSKAKAKKLRPAIYHGIEKSSVRDVRSLHDYDWIYPLRKTKFMGEMMPIPNQPEILLDYYYGDFMDWPDEIRPKHPDIQQRMTLEAVRLMRDVADGKVDLMSASSRS